MSDAHSYKQRICSKTSRLLKILIPIGFKKSTTIPQNNMEKPNYKEWSVNFNGKTIRVTNWWSVEAGELKGTADLYVDDEHLDKNTDLIANPKKALLSKYKVSDDIKSIEVFAAGALKIKILIMVNGKIVLQEKLSLIDRFAKLFFSKN